MNRLLQTSLLLFIVFLAGCATTKPNIVGQWEIQPSSDAESMDTARVFADGTVLVTGTENDSSILLGWSMTEEQIVINDSDGHQFLVMLPERNLMIWKEPGENHSIVVLHRKSK